MSAGQFRRLHRMALPREIGWTCNDVEARQGDAPADEAGVEIAGDTDRQIIALLHDVDAAIGKIERNVDRRVAFEKGRDHQGEMKVAELGRRRDP
ncbi:MAG: hypothetical protein H5U22_04075 [Rhizobium sp.]|nr:hypothetical protein [Rhizobium sp.]